MKMNRPIKLKWLKALRSGKYTQGFFSLKDKTNGGYCCLGVLCEVMEVGYKGSSFYPSFKTLQVAGLDKKTAGKLSGFNDDDTWSFKKIANWIEKNL